MDFHSMKYEKVSKLFVKRKFCKNQVCRKIYVKALARMLLKTL